MFEKASKMKLRFKSGKGLIGVEELWDMPLKPGLDKLAQESYKKLQNTVTSFVDNRSVADTEEQLRLDILKHVIATKIDERDARADAAARKEQKNRIMDIIEAKKDAELQNKSLDELKQMVGDL